MNVYNFKRVLPNRIGREKNMNLINREASDKSEFVNEYANQARIRDIIDKKEYLAGNHK